MQEQLISFETAKLAKEKGFNEDCLYHYTPGYNAPLENSVKDKKYVATHHLYANNYDFITDRWGGGSTNSIICPTQSLLQKWLREKHKIYVYVYIMEDSESVLYFDFGIKQVINWLTDKSVIPTNFNTYEEALEAGLLEALKLI